MVFSLSDSVQYCKPFPILIVIHFTSRILILTMLLINAPSSENLDNSWCTGDSWVRNVHCDKGNVGIIKQLWSVYLRSKSLKH